MAEKPVGRSDDFDEKPPLGLGESPEDWFLERWDDVGLGTEARRSLMYAAGLLHGFEPEVFLERRKQGQVRSAVGKLIQMRNAEPEIPMRRVS